MSLLPGRKRDVDNPDSRRRTVPETSEKHDPLTELDEDGTELHKEARVWKVYVNEADRHDTELVKGWNDSTDVILIFAALFSAISTAFIIESSKMLQEDPLLAISQALMLIANNTQTSGSPSPLTNSAPFAPSRTAIWVNALWYLSLSLSLATSFIAILAKDWCHSFMSNRTGHPYLQTRQRQQKWDMIQGWRMPELLAALPSIIHLALFLFALGLCVLLWNTHLAVALPVVCVSGVAFCLYSSLSVAATFLDYFPYPTIVSRICRTEIVRRMLRILYELPFFLVFVLVFMIGVPLALLARLSGKIYYTLPSPMDYPFGKIEDWMDKLLDKIFERALKWLEPKSSSIRSGIKRAFARGSRTSSTGDQVTSLALSWLIKYCEVPESVDIALQSIAGATNRIARQPLLDCRAPLEILRRLASSSLYRGLDTQSGVIESLYLRALSFLGTSANLESETGRNPGSELKASIWDLQMQAEEKLAELIAIGGFNPTESDLKALRIGSIVASTSQKILKEEIRNADVKKIFDSIIELLHSHLARTTQLHDTALLSLVHAATLLLLSAPSSAAIRYNSATSLSAIPMSSGSFPELSGGWKTEYSFADVEALLPLCAQLLRSDRYSKPTIETTATCMILYAMCMKQIQMGQPYDLKWSEAVIRGIVEQRVGGANTLGWICNIKFPGLGAPDEETSDLASYVSKLGDSFLSETQIASPTTPPIALVQLGTEASDRLQNAVDSSVFYLLCAIYTIGPVLTPSPALYLGIVEIMCHIPPSSPLFACGAQMLSKCPFPTLSEELTTALEQRDLVRLLETTSHSDNEPKQYFARGQLWLLLSLYIYAGDTASGRDKLKVQLDKCGRNGGESVMDRYQRLGEVLYSAVLSDPVFRDLGLWVYRLDECTSQFLDRKFWSSYRIAGFPRELRGLSSFTAWPQRAGDASTNEPRPVEEVTDEARARTDATDLTTAGGGAAGGDGQLQSAGQVADRGEAETLGEDDAGQADFSQDLEVATQGPTDGDSKSLADANSQQEVGEVRGEGNSGVEAVGDERRVADAGDATEATDGPQSEGGEAQSEDVAQGGENEGDVLIRMDRLENRSGRSISGV